MALLVGCSSDDPPSAIEPDPNGTAAPDEPEPDGPEPDAEPSIFDGQLYPPLPPTEPDSSLPFDEELQRFYLDLHFEAYEAVQTAITTSTADRDVLARVTAGDELEVLIANIEANADAGVVTLAPDSEVLWVEIILAEEGRGAVAECVVSGPSAGTYDVESGEPVDLRGETTAFIRATEYEPVAEGEQPFRRTRVTTSDNPEMCGA